MFQIDLAITKFLNNPPLIQSGLSAFFQFISNNFGKLTLVILVILLLSAYLVYRVIKLDSNSRSIKSALIEFSRFILTFGISSVITEFLKKLVERGRPFTLDTSIIVREIVDESDKLQSFPSGHTIIAFSIAWFFILGEYPKSLKLVSLVLAMLVALSRIYLGVHFISDILGSVIISLFIATIVRYFANIIRKTWIQ